MRWTHVVAAMACLLGVACGGGQTQPVVSTNICDQPSPELPSGATFGDVVDQVGADEETSVCVATGGEQTIVQWTAAEQPRITLAADAVHVGTSSTTMCAWYGRCDPTTGQREFLDEESVLNTVDCLADSNAQQDVVVQASRDVSAQVLMAVVERVRASGRQITVERRPLSSWFPCRPTGRSRVREALPEDVVRSAAAPRVRQVRRCFARPRRPRGHAGGRLLLRFTVAPDGSVEGVTIAANSLELPEVEQCVLARVRGWTFPAPGGDESTVVTYPLEFGRDARRR